jgi:hypothetical protein
MTNCLSAAAGPAIFSGTAAASGASRINPGVPMKTRKWLTRLFAIVAGLGCAASAMAQGYGPMQPASMGEAFEDSGSYAMQDPMGYGGGYQDPAACNSCNSCNSCNDDFCCGPKGCGLSVGGSAYILSPYFSRNPGFNTTVGAAVPATSVTTTSNMDWNYTASPAIWVGYRSAGGLKTRARFFYFDQYSNPLTTTVAAGTTLTAPLNFTAPNLAAVFNTAVAGTTGTFTANSNLFINNIDVEAGVYESAAGPYSFQLYAGARYLYIAENFSLRNTAAIPTSLSFFHNFTGGGPTLFAQGSRQIGCSNWSIYGNARGALLVGQARQLTTVNSTIAGVAVVPVSASASNLGNSTLPTMEIEGGAEYRIAHGRKLIFLRAGVVDMTFFNFGSPTDTISNLSLLGGRVSVGCNY